MDKTNKYKENIKKARDKYNKRLQTSRNILRELKDKIKYSKEAYNEYVEELYNLLKNNELDI